MKSKTLEVTTTAPGFDARFSSGVEGEFELRRFLHANGWGANKGWWLVAWDYKGPRAVKKMSSFLDSTEH